MLLALIRHLPTEWNRKGFLQGRRDTPLAALDARDAAAVEQNRRRLETLGPFDIVLASSLRRTQQTARIYGYPGFTAEPLLDELDYGPWEGKLREEFYQALGRRWFDDPGGLALGETMQEFEARLRRFARKYAPLPSVLAFAHGSWMRAFRSLLEHGDLSAMNRFWIENNELLVAEVPAGRLETGRATPGESRSKRVPAPSPPRRSP